MIYNRRQQHFYQDNFASKKFPSIIGYSCYCRPAMKTGEIVSTLVESRATKKFTTAKH
jgi:hypothetical protein